MSAAAATPSLASIAKAAVANNDNSVEIAMEFVEKAVSKEFAQIATNDRYVKIGRSIRSLLQLYKDDSAEADLEQSLTNLRKECDLLGSGKVKVPKVRYGKTELQMPIVSLGCMRFQEEWGARVNNFDLVGTDCQDNLIAILKHSISLGMTHIETARGYGCSDLQLGVAFRQLFSTGFCKREDLIIQTKVNAQADSADFRKMLETSIANLKVEYIDLFSFHGMNLPEQYEQVFGNGDGKETCMDVINEYKKAGKIRHVGFSTHAPEDLIRRFIETDAFEYINLHYHYFGSYTTTGVGPHAGNLGNLQLLKEKDMGVFIISAFDKGGKVYEPSNKLRSLTLPTMEPMTFAIGWMWNHGVMEGSPIHTAVVGAARPADLDQPAVAAYMHANEHEVFFEDVKTVTARLEKAKEDALGKDWLENCFKGVPKSNTCKTAVEHNQIVWCHNMIKAFGLFAFAKDRYTSLENNLDKWDDAKSTEDNIKAGGLGWGYVPGLPIKDDVDYSEDLADVPEAYRAKVIEAEQFVHKLCKKHRGEKDDKEDNKKPKEEIPFEWQTAYNMKPWKDFPERPSNIL